MSSSAFIEPPSSERVLLERCKRLVGCKIGDLASLLDCPIPTNMVRAKGWVGQLFEQILGATAQSKPVPDFEAIGVELKSLPIVDKGPKESTYVCTVDLAKLTGKVWEESEVYLKLKRVLWLPYQAASHIPLPDRLVGQALLWSPSLQQSAALKADWQELTDRLAMGDVENVRAHQGQYLQIRPKAANSRARTWGVAADGRLQLTLPRGFYLRANFTREILKAHYA